MDNLRSVHIGDKITFISRRVHSDYSGKTMTVEEVEPSILNWGDNYVILAEDPRKQRWLCSAFERTEAAPQISLSQFLIGGESSG